MEYKHYLRVTGVMMMLFSSVLLLPLGYSLLASGESSAPFLYPSIVLFLFGLPLWYLNRSDDRLGLSSRAGFAITVLFWLLSCLIGAFPLYLSNSLQLSFTDALFEATSGITTTGATILTGLDSAPRSILLYRQLLQWVGGLGIIVLALAVLPLLGIGGMQLYRAEVPGPVKQSRLSPRISETAKRLLLVYLTLTLGCGFCYWVADMPLFDAICHAMSTVALGGFSTHDASLGFFNSPLIEGIAVIFMVVCGCSFALHYLTWIGGGVRHYWRDEEFRTYLMSIGGFLLLAGLTLALWPHSADFWTATFQVVSFATTTGFVTTDHSALPSLLPVLLVMSAFIGGCAGSTGGGFKVIRILVILKRGFTEIKQLIHPQGVFSLRVSNEQVPQRISESITSFLAMYLIVFILMMWLLLATGLNLETAFSAMGATLNNLGPGLGAVGQNYAQIPDMAKWTLSLAMILGRLEIFTLLVVLSPMFWRK